MFPSVLIASNFEDYSARLEQGFESIGYQCHIARNGNHAVALATSCLPDAIILEARMSKRGGLLVVEYLRQYTDINSLFFLILEEESKRIEGYAELLGFERCFVKTTTCSALIGAVDVLVKQLNKTTAPK